MVEARQRTENNRENHTATEKQRDFTVDTVIRSRRGHNPIQLLGHLVP